jgi:hypothetical protein
LLARTLLEVGIGEPEDWRNSHGDAVQFMVRTIEREASRFDRRAIDRVAHTNISLGTNPISSSWREPDDDPSRVFLAVEATHISVVYLRPTFDLLGKINERLPSTFYKMLRSGVCEHVLCYDEGEARRYLEYRMEEYEELQAEGEEGLERPQSVEEAMGQWLASGLKPFPMRQAEQVVRKLRRGSRARRIMEAVMQLMTMSRRRKPHRPDWRILEEYVSESFFSLPFTILAFHEQDLVCQAFESDEESWLNGGDERCPAFFAIMRPDDPLAVKAAFGHLRHFLTMLEAFGKLLSLLPGTDLLELEP